MGSADSRFREAVRTGNVEQAHELYYRKRSISRDRLQPNCSFGAGYDENTLLHYTALHGMKQLYVDLILIGGRPDQKNKHRHNCLHLICTGGEETSTKVRKDMLCYTIETGLCGMDITHILKEQDEDGNTPLHLAATAGLDDCVEMLVDAGADLFVTNKSKETAADCATHNKHSAIATKLETKMVFHPEDDHEVGLDPDPAALQEIANAPQAMKDSDIRTMKDQLLIETAQLLGVTLFTAEALLKNHGWSKEQLLEAWMDNPADCCEKSGVEMPSLLTEENLYQSSSGVSVLRTNEGEEEEEGEECGICTLPSSHSIFVPCEHHFCKDCWQQYLHSKIVAGDHSILCPEYACYKLVPVEVVEAVVSREMAEKYLHFDIKAFVDSNSHLHWCPHPGCGQAVSMAPTNEDNPMASARDEKRRPLNVHCGKDHYFCWKCGGEPHDPCECDQWKAWLEHVEEMKPKVGDMTISEADEAASSKWLAKRSKPCPKCKAPIERTEGCNHMCCRKCRHDFCWVCLDVWRIHNSSTGGYFECNRYDAKKKAEEMLIKRKKEVMSGLEEVEKIARFLHYYERYKDHKESLALEEPYLTKARHKMVELAASVETLGDRRVSLSKGTLDMSFIEEAVKGLLQARRVLIATYCYGYYIKGNSAKKMFENMQGALEEVTEMLAEVVARPHLRKPRSEIIRLTREAREKRVRLIREVKAGLPPPTPPPLRDSRRLRLHPLRVPRRTYGDSDSSTSSSPDTPPSSEYLDPGTIVRFLDDLRARRDRLQDETHDHSQDQSHDQSHDDGDGELQRALAVSRREFEEERQLKDDIERAKTLSLQRTQQLAGGGTTGDNDVERASMSGAAATATSDRPWYKQVPMLTSHKPVRTPPLSTPPPPPPSPRATSFNLPNNDGLDWLMMDLLDPGDSTTSERGASRYGQGLGGGRGGGGVRRNLPPRMEWLQTVPERDTGGTPVRGEGGSKDKNLDRMNNLDHPGWLLNPLLQPPIGRSPTQGGGNGGGGGVREGGGGGGAGGAEGHLLDNDLFVPLSPPSSDGGEFGPVYGEDEDLRRAIELSLRERPSRAPHPDNDTMMDISGPQFHSPGPAASVSPPPGPAPLPLNLPPELRHLLQTNERSGKTV